MRKVRYLGLGVIILIMTYVIACQGVIPDAYKTLSVSKATYDWSLSSAADLDKQSLLTEEQKDNIIKAGNKYLYAHNEAVAAFKKFYESGLTDDGADYLEKLSEALALLVDLRSQVKSFSNSGGK